MRSCIFFAFAVLSFLICPVPYSSAQENPAVFPCDYEPIPIQEVRDGVPLRLDLGEYMAASAAEQVSKIGYQFLDREITVFQDPRNPLNIAILYPMGKPGLQIFPLRFEFKDGKKCDFFIPCRVRRAEEQKTPSLPRLLPFEKRMNKKNKTEEYVFYYYDETNTNTLDPKSIKVLFGNERLIKNIGMEENKIIVPLPEGALKGQILRVFVKTQSGKADIEAFAWESSEGKKTFSLDWNNNILYYIFTDRFQNGNPENDKPSTDPGIKPEANWQGGDFAGLESRIREGYFQNLGVNGIILSPVNKNAEGAWRETRDLLTTSFHGFWPISPRETDPHFGSLDDLKSLIQTAHANNLKIIFDYPITHVHQDHPWFKNHPDWFTVPGQEAYPGFNDTSSSPSVFQSFLPLLNFQNTEAQDQIISDVIWWVETTNADGLWYRHSTLIPPLFRKKLFQAVREKIEIPQKKKIYQNMDDKKTDGISSDKTSFDLPPLAMAHIFTQPGAPIILYGDEIGMTRGEYPAALQPMRFNKDLAEHEKLNWEQTARLCRLRLDHKALRTGESLTLLDSKDDLVFLKSDFSEKILCVFHRGDAGVDLAVDLPLPFRKIQKAKSLLAQGRSKIEKGRIRVEMPPRSVDFFLLEGLE